MPFNLLVPRSRCQSCAHQLAWFENIPVLSYVLLRGKCSACGQAYGLRYPLVELFTGVLFYGCVLRWGASYTALAWCGFLAALLTLALIDWDTELLPDSITLPLAPWELALGTEVAVPTLTGKINLKVPAGSQNGQRMRAKGHGLLNKAGQRGYLFVQLKAVMPKASSDEVKALWQELAKKAAFNPRENF